MSDPDLDFHGKVFVYLWPCNINNATVLPDFTKFFQGITKVPLCNTIHQTPNMDNHRRKRLVWIFISLKCQTFIVTRILFYCSWASASKCQIIIRISVRNKTISIFLLINKAFCIIYITLALHETRARLKMGEGWLVPSWVPCVNHHIA